MLLTCCCSALITGVCPQHNILFDLLTVREHLEMFALIKGMNRADVPAAVAEMIKEVSLLIPYTDTDTHS